MEECETSGARAAAQALSGCVRVRIPGPHSQRGAGGSSAASLGLLLSVGSEKRRPDRRGRERKPNSFSGNWLWWGSRGADLRSPKRPRPRLRDVGEVKAIGHLGRPRAGNLMPLPQDKGRQSLGDKGGH